MASAAGCWPGAARWCFTVTDLIGNPILDCVQLVIDDAGGTTTGMSGLTFLNLPTDVTQLTIRHPGIAAGSFTASAG